MVIHYSGLSMVKLAGSSLDQRSAAAVAALADRVARQAPLLARRMVDRLKNEVPFYAHLPEEQLEGDILAICHHNIGVFLRLLATGHSPSESDLDAIRSSAARRAEERVPLQAILRAHHVGLMMMWEYFQHEVPAVSQEQLLFVATVAMEYIEGVTTLVSDAYVEEHEIIYGAERDVQRSLVNALLSGAPTADLAAQAGIHVHSGYLVLALDMGHSLDEDQPGVETAVATRRKIRRVGTRLSATVGEDALTLLDVAGGIVLIPTDADDSGGVAAEVPRLVASLSEAAHSPIVGGYAWHPGLPGIATSRVEAKALLELALQLRCRPGAYRIDDLLLEYALSRDPSVLALLAAVLEPLGRRGADLVETLESYFDAQLDRRLTAATLHIHPNTLDYRLKRIRTLTGVDTNSASGITMLRAGLLARKVRGELRTNQGTIL